MILRCAGRELAPTPISEQSGAHYVPRQLQKLSLGYLLHPKQAKPGGRDEAINVTFTFDEEENNENKI